MICAILFSTVACFWGIPTSESHGLIAGISGAAIAYGGINSINITKWINVLLGLGWSIIGSIVITQIIYRITKKVLMKIKVNKIKKAQILACCGMSFAHGAQDGLKFIGLFYMYTRIITNNIFVINELLIVIICALTMGFGVSIGGRRIVSTVGEKMVKLNNEEALCSDFSTATTLIIANLFGMPVSTTHVKTMTITVIPNSQNSLNKSTFFQIALTWGLTFPVCGILSFLIMKMLV